MFGTLELFLLFYGYISLHTQSKEQVNQLFQQSKINVCSTEARIHDSMRHV